MLLQFRPPWQEAGRLDTLISGIEELRNGDLDPTDYHVEALRSYRLDVRMQSPLTLEDRADLGLLATDALMPDSYHVFVGKDGPGEAQLAVALLASLHAFDRR